MDSGLASIAFKLGQMDRGGRSYRRVSRSYRRFRRGRWPFAYKSRTFSSYKNGRKRKIKCKPVSKVWFWKCVNPTDPWAARTYTRAPRKGYMLNAATKRFHRVYADGTVSAQPAVDAGRSTQGTAVDTQMSGETALSVE